MVFLDESVLLLVTQCVFVDPLYFERKLRDSMPNRKICVFRKPTGMTKTKVIIMIIVCHHQQYLLLRVVVNCRR